MRFAKSAITSAGSSTLGVDTSLDSISIGLFSGHSTIDGLAVANPEVRSYCDVGVGPLGRWIAVFAGIQGDISIEVTRMPSRLKSKGTLWPEQSCKHELETSGGCGLGFLFQQ